jgi:hypothetical protein
MVYPISKPFGMRFTVNTRRACTSKPITLTLSTHHTYTHFTRALVNSREDKLTTQYSPAVRELIKKSYAAETKALVISKSAADPAHSATFKDEGLAALTLFTNSITAWEQEAREQALLHFNKQKAQKEANESQAMENATVSDPNYFSSNCDNLYSPDLQPSPCLPRQQLPGQQLQQIPPLPSEGQLPAQRKRKRKRKSSGQRINSQNGPPWNNGRQTQRLDGVRPLITTYATLTSTSSSSNNRRLSKAQKNRMRIRDEISDDLRAEAAELEMMKHNLRQIGVAQKLVHNLSGKVIPTGALNCLALGSKFIPVPNSDTEILSKSIKAFKRTIRLRHIFQNEEDNVIPQYWIPSTWEPPYLYNRRDIETMLTFLEHSIHNNNSVTPPNINSNDIKEYNKLLRNKDLLVILADKNLGYAVVTKSWYISRCLEHLDSDSYTNVTKEYYEGANGQTTEQLLCDSIFDLVDHYKHYLEEDEIKWILQPPKEQWLPMRFYITAKVHKKPVKGRPIVPSMTWMTFHLSEWIANQLNPLIPATQWVLKDSYDLLDSLKQLNQTELPNTLRVASADVDALYPSMDIKTGLQLIKQFIDELHWENRHKRDFLIKAMEFVLTKGYITFQEQIYQQTNGAAMGSPMIPPYANIFMYQLEKDIVHKHTASGSLILFKRFIDDVFIITRNSDISELQEELNTMKPFIKLTWTPPAKHCNFLDLVISIKNNKLHTNVYQKQLNTYAYLPFHSYHTTAQKKGFIKGEAIRYARICTSEADFKLMVKLFTLRLQRRGCPLSFINKALGQVQHKDKDKYTVSKNGRNKKAIPLLFKTEYNPAVSHSNVRAALNQFTANILKLASIHPSVSQKVTICYKVPPKLHNLSLKARKGKGL